MLPVRDAAELDDADVDDVVEKSNTIAVSITDFGGSSTKMS